MPKYAALFAVGLLLAMAPVHAAENADLAARLLPGKTSLLDVGARRVFWQSYGKEPVPLLPGDGGM